MTLTDRWAALCIVYCVSPWSRIQGEVMKLMFFFILSNVRISLDLCSLASHPIQKSNLCPSPSWNPKRLKHEPQNSHNKEHPELKTKKGTPIINRSVRFPWEKVTFWNSIMMRHLAFISSYLSQKKEQALNCRLHGSKVWCLNHGHLKF